LFGRQPRLLLTPKKARKELCPSRAFRPSRSSTIRLHHKFGCDYHWIRKFFLAAGEASFSPLISAFLATWSFLSVFILLTKDFFCVGMVSLPYLGVFDPAPLTMQKRCQTFPAVF
jgi:hypothetical protein